MTEKTKIEKLWADYNAYVGSGQEPNYFEEHIPEYIALKRAALQTLKSWDVSLKDTIAELRSLKWDGPNPEDETIPNDKSAALEAFDWLFVNYLNKRGDEDTDQCIRAIGYCNMVRAALSERGDTPPVDGDKISCDGVVAITQHDNISEPMKGYFKAECNCSIFQGRTINEVAGRWAINRKCGKITIASALDSAAKEK